MTPTSPLPWAIFPDRNAAEFSSTRVAEASDGTIIVYDLCGAAQDSEYLIHACNAYPELVRCLQRVMAVSDNPLVKMDIKTFLESIGE